MRSVVEIEAKYDVDGALALPDLVGVAGVATARMLPEMVLTATYFDTAGKALAGLGATLRRRTGGTDDGWHLKLPVADGERLEVHRALGRSSTPPPALTSLLAATLGRDVLVPVARLVNHRTVHELLDAGGGVLAELADDSVTGERLDVERGDVETTAVTWREVEIELVGGDRDVLGALDSAARAGGLTPAAAASKVARVLGSAPPAAASGPGRARRKDPSGPVLDAALRTALAGVLQADPLLRVDRPGAAARLLAALDRLRAALALRRQVVGTEDHTALRAELSRSDATIARLAELDRALPRVRSALETQPRELLLGPVARRLDRELAAARRVALASVREVLDSAEYLGLLDAVRDLDRDAPLRGRRTGRAGDVLPDQADRALRRAERRVARAARADPGSDAVGSLVGSRRAVARAGLAASLAPAGSAPAGGLPKLLALLAEIDGTLAELAASVRAQHVLRDAAVASTASGESAFTPGRLHGLQDLAAHLLRRRLAVDQRALKRLRRGE